jgi:kinetochore protein Spc25
MKKKEIEILQLKTSAHAQTLLKETAETAEMNAAIATLTTTRDAHLRTKAQLQEQIASTQAAIDSKLLAQRMHAMSISAQSRHDIPELDFWTQYLGLRIEGAGMSDRIKFVFCQVDERDWGRECSFELDTQSREYKVRVCRPKLEKEMLERLVEGLNEGRALGPFLKGMRDLFVETVKSQ